MLESYITLLASHTLAVGLFLAQLALRPLVRYFDLKPDEQDLTGWVQRYKHLPKFWKGLLDGVLLTVNSALGEWYIQTIAIPRLTGDFPSQVFGLFMLFVGAGIGVSMGKALTEDGYTWYSE